MCDLWNFRGFIVLMPDNLNSGIELRQHERIAVRWRFKISVDGKSYIDGTTENISASGAGLVMPSAPKNGARAHVVFSALVKGECVKFDAIVLIRHVSLSGESFRCGVEFKKINQQWVSLIGLMVSDSQRAKNIMRVA